MYLLFYIHVLCLVNGALSTEIGKIHFEESYQILHGQLDIEGTEKLLDALDNFGNTLLNDTEKRRKLPNALILQEVIGNDILTRTRKLRLTLDTATYSISSNKRGLDFLGDWIHQLTGIPGPFQHEKELSAINHIKSALSNQDKLNMAVHDDVSNIIKQINNEETVIKKNTQHLNKLYDRTRDDEIDMERCIKLMAMKFKIDNKLNAIDHSISDFQFILLEAKNHHLSPRLINATSLQQKIKEISADSEGLTPIISYNNSGAYYGLPTTRAILVKKSVHIFTRVPLYRPSQSMTLHAIDYASKIKKEHVNEDFDYLLMNKKNTHFSTMTDAQLIRAIEIPGRGLMTDIRPVEIEVGLMNCTTAICTSKILHITQIRKDTFAFRLPEITPYTSYCSSSDKVTQDFMPKRGTISLGQDCSLKTKYFFVHKVISHQNSAFLVYVPEVTLQDLSTLFNEQERNNKEITAHNNTITKHSEHIDELNTTISKVNTDLATNKKEILAIRTETDEIKVDSPTHWGISISAITIAGICLFIVIPLIIALYCACKNMKEIQERADRALNRHQELRERFELTERIRSGL